jgi:uncharacterized membrane protein
MMKVSTGNRESQTAISQFGRSRKGRFILLFALVGLTLALILGAARIYLIHSSALDRDISFGAAFDELTVTLWPGGFYLSLIKIGDSFAKVTFIAAIAVLSNAVFYGLVGWVVWGGLRFLRLVKG